MKRTKTYTPEAFKREFPDLYEELIRNVAYRREIDEAQYKYDLQRMCSEAGFSFVPEVDTLRYSVSCSQGDGVSFTCNLWPEPIESKEQLELEKKYHTLREDYPIIYALMIAGWYNPAITLSESRYCHPGTMQVQGEDLDLVIPDLDDEVGGGTMFKHMKVSVAAEVAKKQLDSFEEEFLEAAKGIATEIYNMMRSEVDYWFTEQSFLESLESIWFRYFVTESDAIEYIELYEGKLVVAFHD